MGVRCMSRSSRRVERFLAALNLMNRDRNSKISLYCEILLKEVMYIDWVTFPNKVLIKKFYFQRIQTFRC